MWIHIIFQLVHLRSSNLLNCHWCFIVLPFSTFPSLNLIILVTLVDWEGFRTLWHMNDLVWNTVQLWGVRSRVWGYKLVWRPLCWLRSKAQFTFYINSHCGNPLFISKEPQEWFCHFICLQYPKKIDFKKLRNTYYCCGEDVRTTCIMPLPYVFILWWFDAFYSSVDIFNRLHIPVVLVFQSS